MKQSVFTGLIGRQILSVHEVVIIENGVRFEPKDSFVFETDDGSTFQLLVSHYQKVFRKCDSRSALQIDGEYEPGAQAITEPIAVNRSLPFSVSSLIEIWVGDENSRWLFGVIFRDKTDSSLAVCTEGDEAEIMDEEKLVHLSQQLLGKSYLEVLYSFFPGTARN